MLCRLACIRIVLITATCCLAPTLHAQAFSATLAKELKTAQQYEAILAIPTSKPAVSTSTNPALAAIRIQASTGDARAEFSLGAHYYYGRGVPQSYSKANKWFRAAATQGYRYAEWSLGRDEYYGRGGPKNWPRALYWLRLARANGLHTYELASLEAWRTQYREQVEATQVPPSIGCTSQGGPSQVTVANESPDGKRIVQVEIDGRPSPLFGVNDYLAPGQEMIFPVFPYANDPENYNVSLQGIYHWYTYHVASCHQMTIIFRY